MDVAGRYSTQFRRCGFGVDQGGIRCSAVRVGYGVELTTFILSCDYYLLYHASNSAHIAPLHTFRGVLNVLAAHKSLRLVRVRQLRCLHEDVIVLRKL